MHGGASLKGAESPRYVHGKFSKYLPSDMMMRFEEFLDDPRRLSLENEMALTRTLISERLQKLKSINTSEAWEKLGKLYKQFINARGDRQREREERLIGEIGQVIKHGTDAMSTRKETMKMIDLERRLVNTQRQLYMDAGELITRGMAITIMGHLLEAVKENVIPLPGGPEAVTAVARAVGRLLGTLGDRGAHNRGKEGSTVNGQLAD
jgi:hypothetical protein